MEAAEVCERAAKATNQEQEMAAAYAVMQNRIVQQTLQIQSAAAKIGGLLPGHERKPLSVDGDDIGIVEARVPAKLFYHLVQQKNFGLDGFYSDEGIRDLHKGYGFTKVKHVSAKPTFSFSRGGRWDGAKGRVNFGANVLNLAN